MEIQPTPEEKMHIELHVEIMKALRKIWEKLETIEKYARNIEQQFIVNQLNMELQNEENNLHKPTKQKTDQTDEKDSSADSGIKL